MLLEWYSTLFKSIYITQLTVSQITSLSSKHSDTLLIHYCVAPAWFLKDWYPLHWACIIDPDQRGLGTQITKIKIITFISNRNTLYKRQNFWKRKLFMICVHSWCRENFCGSILKTGYNFLWKHSRSVILTCILG